MSLACSISHWLKHNLNHMSKASLFQLRWTIKAFPVFNQLSPNQFTTIKVLTTWQITWNHFRLQYKLQTNKTTTLFYSVRRKRPYFYSTKPRWDALSSGKYHRLFFNAKKQWLQSIPQLTKNNSLLKHLFSIKTFQCRLLFLQADLRISHRYYKMKN